MTVLDNYVCIACGLVEGYSTDSSKLRDAVKNRDRVEPDIEGENELINPERSEGELTI